MINVRLSGFILSYHIFVPSGHPDLFNYAQTSVFNVKYLGHLKNVSPQSGRLSSAENQTVTLEAIDTAQVQIAPSNSSPNSKVSVKLWLGYK